MVSAHVDEERLLLQCPRTIRIAAIMQLPAFLGAYRDVIESAIATIERAENALK